MPRILVIDDDPVIRLVLMRNLQKQGYEVALARNGEEGSELASQLRPALIICDWMMPGRDGLEVCRQVKANPDLSTTFFILLTSRGEVEDRVRGLDSGADDFLSKPIEMNELKARVRAGLRLHQLTQDLQTQKQLLEAELAEAADYVRSLLPPPLLGPPAINTCFIPSRQLGGDCFDYFWLDPDYLAIYLLDVSGHGLGSALPSISVLNLLRSQSLPGVNFYLPDRVLTGLNETFQMSGHNERYFTIWYGVYNKTKRQLVYASAGHPPAILISGEADATTTAKRLKTAGLPIGMFSDAQYVSDRCEVEAGSSLYIFSDGIYEINQPDGETWTLDGFVGLLSDLSQANNISLDTVLGSVRAIGAKETFDDDLSLLQVSFAQGSP
ncbi:MULTISPECIES: PP2C family protein-serine/threonine phosphatase [Trichocoleus]|uniref:SpoIIE family protein phosphatase n=1 Tax=Trichocoleus desertorum GB2-A4 TaxID=2933944 RepID=A0ABV0J6Z8_9CYAN|nr:SpoIIE family protein phosphatase [Trichocoleus sp. FACHB-46]MBD1863521.1 SpoIIE family protein phosphatase [Trichocoleus sp. FACHB-46]